KNHALHMVWHALALLGDLENKKPAENEKQPFRIDGGFAIPDLVTLELSARNLRGDIFSAIFQTLVGSEDAVNQICMQRVNDTLSPARGFISENYPFPMCVETLQFALSEDQFIQHRTGK